MKIKLTQSFVEVNMVPFRVGDTLDVPASLAQEWIKLGRAVSLETDVQQPDPKAAKPKPEHAIKPKPETRTASAR